MKRDFKGLEKRRFQAVKLLQTGDLNQSEAARRLKVCRQTVSRWMEEFRTGGADALKQAGRAGRRSELSEADREHLEELLLQSPEKLGYESPLWTCARVAHLIENEFGVEYHPGHVWKILDDMGWSFQRPVGRVRERNEETICHGRRVKWPATQKNSKEAVPSSSSMKVE